MIKLMYRAKTPITLPLYNLQYWASQKRLYLPVIYLSITYRESQDRTSKSDFNVDDIGV